MSFICQHVSATELAFGPMSSMSLSICTKVITLHYTFFNSVKLSYTFICSFGDERLCCSIQEAKTFLMTFCNLRKEEEEIFGSNIFYNTVLVFQTDLCSKTDE